MEKFRKDFPFLEKMINGRPVIYFDNACMSLRPKQVINAVVEYYNEYSGCGGRSIHTISTMVSDKFSEARERIAKFIDAKKSEEIIFTRNTTEGINLVAQSFEFENNDTVLTTDKEHNSNLLPWHVLSKRKGIKHDVILSNPDNTFSLENFSDKLNKNVKLVSIVHTSNLDGYTNPVKEIIKISHDNGSLVMLDGAQSVPHKKINVKKLDVDFMAWSVTGETPLLISFDKKIKLLLIEKVIDMLKEGKEIKVLTLDKNGKITFQKIIDYLVHTDVIYSIKHEHCAVPINTTKYHSLYVWKNGEIFSKKVEDIKKGDYLITFNKKNISKNKDKKIRIEFSFNHWRHEIKEDVIITKNLMRLIGYFLAEGCLNKTNYKIQLTFNKNEKHYIEDCKRLIEELKDTTFYIDKFKQIQNLKGLSFRETSRRIGLDIKTVQKYLGCSKRCSGVFIPIPKKMKTHKTVFGSRIDISFNSRKFYEFFKLFCGEKTEKHLPYFVWFLPKKFVLELLKGYIRGNASKKEKYRIRIKSIAKNIIMELSWLLKLNGISNSIGFVPKKGNHKDIYNIVIQKSELKNIKEFKRKNKVNDMPKDKLLPVDGLRILYQQICPKYNTQVVTVIRDGNKRAIRDDIKNVISWIEKTHKKPINSRLKKILKTYKMFIDSDIGTVKVKSVEKIGRKKVYDISVKKLERFFGGFYPILLHNSGHKMLGPAGTGVLYGKEHLLQNLKPFMLGGETVLSSTYDSHELLKPPEKFEAGLQNYPGMIGLGEAVKYLENVGSERIEEHERNLNRIITQGIIEIPGIKIIGPHNPELRGGILTFNIENVDYHNIALILDETANIMIRSGQHCVHSWFNAHGIKGSVRASLYFYNTKEEVQLFIDKLKEVAKLR